MRPCATRSVFCTDRVLLVVDEDVAAGCGFDRPFDFGWVDIGGVGCLLECEAAEQDPAVATDFVGDHGAAHFHTTLSSAANRLRTVIRCIPALSLLYLSFQTLLRSASA